MLTKQVFSQPAATTHGIPDLAAVLSNTGRDLRQHQKHQPARGGAVHATLGGSTRPRAGGAGSSAAQHRGGRQAASGHAAAGVHQPRVRQGHAGRHRDAQAAAAGADAGTAAAGANVHALADGAGSPTSHTGRRGVQSHAQAAAAGASAQPSAGGAGSPRLQQRDARGAAAGANAQPSTGGAGPSGLQQQGDEALFETSRKFTTCKDRLDEQVAKWAAEDPAAKLSQDELRHSHEEMTQVRCTKEQAAGSRVQQCR